ncbi:MAG: hypothetical protein ACMVO3_20410 [Thalassobaculum sp.]
MNEVGQFVPVDWWEVVFNPSFPYRLVHMVLAAYPDDRLRGRRGRRPAPAAGSRQPAGASDVLHGHVDGRGGRADPGDRRRSARPQHA